MGFSIYYQTTRPVSPKEANEVRKTADRGSAGRTWLRCEPVQFYVAEPDDGGRLFGGSKLNFSPHPDDAASAATMDLPDGDVRDLFDVLCQISREHRVDWEIGHSHELGPVGSIRGGDCDPELMKRANALVDLTDYIREYERGGFSGGDDEAGEDEGPRILRLWGDP